MFSMCFRHSLNESAISMQINFGLSVTSMCYRTYMILRVSSHKQIIPELRKYQILLPLKGQTLVLSQTHAHTHTER